MSTPSPREVSRRRLPIGFLVLVATNVVLAIVAAAYTQIFRRVFSLFGGDYVRVEIVNDSPVDMESVRLHGHNEGEWVIGTVSARTSAVRWCHPQSEFPLFVSWTEDGAPRTRAINEYPVAMGLIYEHQVIRYEGGSVAVKDLGL
jgi:hypothetical protein